jgi:hypothetical protein
MKHPESQHSEESTQFSARDVHRGSAQVHVDATQARKAKRQNRQVRALYTVGGLLAIVGAYAIFLGVSASTHAASGAVDCDSNAIVYCGIPSKADLAAKISANAALYAKFGIKASMASSMIEMYVYRDGHVTAGGQGKTVATNVLSVGREFIPGSTAINGVWERPPEVSFLDNRLQGWAYMKNGQFIFGILQSCGNPILTTTKPTPQPTTVTIPVSVTIKATSKVKCPTGTTGSTVTVTEPGSDSGTVSATGATHADAVAKAQAKIPAEKKLLTKIATARAMASDHAQQVKVGKTLKCTKPTPPGTPPPPPTPPTQTPPTITPSAPLAQAGPEFALGGGAVASAVSIMGYALHESRRKVKEAILDKIG